MAHLNRVGGSFRVQKRGKSRRAHITFYCTEVMKRRLALAKGDAIVIYPRVRGFAQPAKAAALRSRLCRWVCCGGRNVFRPSRHALVRQCTRARRARSTVTTGLPHDSRRRPRSAPPLRTGAGAASRTAAFADARY